MEKKGAPTESIGEGLLQLVDAEYNNRLQREISDFTFGFTIHRRRPTEALQASKRSVENPADLLDREILSLYSRIIELGVLGEPLATSEHRHILPFVTIDAKSRKIQVKIIPFTGTASIRDELAQSTALMREIEAYLQDSTVRPDAHPHIRELVKALFADVYSQLHRGKKTRDSLPIDFAKANAVMGMLEFVPGESLRAATYDDKYDKFKSLMQQKDCQFDATQTDFIKWVTTASEDPVRSHMCQTFNRDMESFLQKKTDKFKTNLQNQFQQLAESRQSRIA